MGPLNASELLDVWERGRLQPHHRRALLLLAAACPESRPEELAGLSIGRRDARLLSLRERLFGPCLASITACPACGERLELGFEVSDILIQTEEEPPSRLMLEMDGYEILFRLPDTTDLAALEMTGVSRQAIRSLMLNRCLSEARYNGMEQKVEELPKAIVEEVMERMSVADPQADVKLNLECPSCRNRWLAPFDILSFFWSEVETWARRLLREVHLLARAYGWSEAEILAMSALRRQSYLEMLGA